MTYDSLFSDMSAICDYFYTVIGRLIIYINSQPLLVLAVFISVTLPSVLFIISLIISLSESSDDITTEGFRVINFFRKINFKKKAKEARIKFHLMKYQLSKAYTKIKTSKNSRSNNPQSQPKSSNKASAAPKNANSSSDTNRRSSANIDVVYDEE